MKSETATSTDVPPNLRYSLQSVQVIQEIKERAGALLSKRAKERALADRRDRITTDDVLNSTAEALREMIAEVQRIIERN